MLEDRFASLLHDACPAVMTTRRRDGSPLTSPVWFGLRDDAVEVVIARGDVKLKHLERHPWSSLTIFEAVPPFRGIRLVGEPERVEGEVTASRLAIAGRYLGRRRGEAFAAGRDPHGTLVRWPLSWASAWDLQAILPDG